MTALRLSIHLSDRHTWLFFTIGAIPLPNPASAPRHAYKGIYRIQITHHLRAFQLPERLTEDGVVILAGRTQSTDYSSFGIVLLKAETIEAAREIMLNDPAVENNVFRAELYRYKTSLFNPDNAK